MAVNFYCCSIIARVIDVKSWPSSLKDEKGLLEVKIIRGFYMDDGPGIKRYISMKIKPSVIIGGQSVNYPGYFTITKEFSSGN